VVWESDAVFATGNSLGGLVWKALTGTEMYGHIVERVRRVGMDGDADEHASGIDGVGLGSDHLRMSTSVFERTHTMEGKYIPSSSPSPSLSPSLPLAVSISPLSKLISLSSPLAFVANEPLLIPSLDPEAEPEPGPRVPGVVPIEALTKGGGIVPVDEAFPVEIFSSFGFRRVRMESPCFVKERA
jgi:hypothetical protein